MKKMAKLFLISIVLLFSSSLLFAQEVLSEEENQIEQEIQTEKENQIEEENQTETEELKSIIRDKESTNSGLAFKNAIGAYFLWNYKSPVGGIQYDRWFTDLFGTKFNFYIFYDPSENSIWNHIMDYTVSTEFTLKLYETAFNDEFASRLFAFCMIGHRGYIERSYVRDDYSNNYVFKELYTPIVLTSIGFGFDFIFAEHLSLPIQIGFMCSFPNDKYAALCIGTGIRYTF